MDGGDRSDLTRKNPPTGSILIATSSYPFHQDDFRALFVHEMAMALVDSGYRVRVITPAAGSNWAGESIQDGIEIVRFKYPGLSFRALRLTGNDGIWQNIRQSPLCLPAVPGFLLAFVQALFKARMRFRPDSVIAHWLIPTGLATSAAFFLSKTRLLHVGHGSDVHLIARLPGGSLLARYLNRTGTIVATSPFIRKKIAPLLKDPQIPVIPLGVRGAAKPERQTGPDKIRLCYMGRIIRGKGLYRALELLRIRPDWSLSIAGEGSEMEKLKAKARANGLQVVFHPPVLGPHKSEFLKKHHYYLFIPEIAREGDFQDNLPVSLLEALRHGLPVIASRLHGLKSVFGEKELIFVGGSPDAICRRIEKIDAPTHARLKSEAHQTGLRFSWATTVTRIIELL